MSLINKMLQDLDRRHAMAAPEVPPPPRQVHAVARSGGREWFWRIVAALMTITIAWVAWVAWQLQPRTLATDLAYRTNEEARARATEAKLPGFAKAGASNPSVGPAKLPTEPAAESPKPPAALPIPPAAPPKPASVVPRPSPPAETLKLALAIETPISERAQAPVTRSKDPAEMSKLKPAAESTIALARKATLKASPAEAKKAVATLAREVAPKPVLPAPPSAAARVEKRDRTRSPAERAEAEFRRAVGLLDQGRTSEAEEGLAAALDKDPSHEATRQALVALQIERRQLDHARRLLQEGLAINPAQAAFAVALARIFLERRDYKAALATLQGAGGTTGNNAEFEAMRGTVMQRMGRHREAAEAYQSALRAQASSPHAWIGLGISLEALAQRAEAADAFRRSLAAGPLSAELKHFAEQRIRALQ